MPSTEAQLEDVRATATARAATSAAVLHSLDALTADVTREAREFARDVLAGGKGGREPLAPDAVAWHVEAAAVRAETATAAAKGQASRARHAAEHSEATLAASTPEPTSAAALARLRAQFGTLERSADAGRREEEELTAALERTATETAALVKQAAEAHAAAARSSAAALQRRAEAVRREEETTRCRAEQAVFEAKAAQRAAAAGADTPVTTAAYLSTVLDAASLEKTVAALTRRVAAAERVRLPTPKPAPRPSPPPPVAGLLSVTPLRRPGGE